MLTPISLSMALAMQVLLGGSSGADGAFAPTVNTVLTVPDGGKFNYTTINIPSNVTVSFTRNQRNDPVSFLATGNVVIAGTLHVDGEGPPTNRGGRGGPGGYDGGDPGHGSAAGAGHGPGGGEFSATSNYIFGSAVHATAHPHANATSRAYGSQLCLPLVGGSGGAGATDSQGGGGGGGALLVASETSITISGTINAQSGDSGGGSSASGSGGCLRIVAPTVTLTGSLNANSGWSGGSGYIRIDAINKTGISGYKNPGAAPGFSVGSNMVVELPTMPSVALISAAGIPTNGQPFFHTLLPGEPSSQPVKFSLSNFPACAKITIRVVPASGVAVESVFEPLSNGVETKNVVIPANTATAIEVYGVAIACPA